VYNFVPVGGGVPEEMAEAAARVKEGGRLDLPWYWKIQVG